MMGDNKVLWLIGGAIAAYLLMPEKVREQILPGGVGGISAMFPEIKMPEFDIKFPDIKFPEFKFPDITFPELPAGDGKGTGETIIKIITESATDEGKKWVDKATQDWDKEALMEKVGIGAGVAAGGVAAWFTKFLPVILSRALPHIGVKGLTTALKLIPYVGWVYAAADIGVTAYELVSGKNIAGPWLGSGEMFSLEQPLAESQESPIKTAPDKLAIAEVQTGLPEAPTKTEFDFQEMTRVGSYTVTPEGKWVKGICW